GDPDLAVVATGQRVLLRKLGKQLGVATVQQALNRLGARIDFGPGNRNLGVFGPQTEDAVDVFQGRAGVGVDGQVGRDTIAALDNALLADENSLTDEQTRGRDSGAGGMSMRIDSTPHLFDFAQGLLEADQGIPWSKAQRIPAVDNYSGAASGS